MICLLDIRTIFRAQFTLKAFQLSGPHLMWLYQKWLGLIYSLGVGNQQLLAALPILLILSISFLQVLWALVLVHFHLQYVALRYMFRSSCFFHTFSHVSISFLIFPYFHNFHQISICFICRTLNDPYVSLVVVPEVIPFLCLPIWAIIPNINVKIVERCWKKKQHWNCNQHVHVSDRHLTGIWQISDRYLPRFSW